MKKNIVRSAACLVLAACLTALCACGGGSAAVSAAPSSAASAAPASSAPAGGTFRVYSFQAGKADAALLWTENGAVLIDSGLAGFGKEITAFLEEQGIQKLDCLILTHFDKDHIGGAAKVLKSVEVDRVLQSDCPKDSDEYSKYLAALDSAGLTAETVEKQINFTLDGVSYTVDPPQQTTYDQDESNNSSLIVSAQYGEKRFLFAGDAEDARLAEFLAEDSGTYDYLKVPYHGHWQDGLTAFLNAVKPAFAVITSSDEEPEDARTVTLLKDLGAQVFLTRESPVLAACDGTTLTVEKAE